MALKAVIFDVGGTLVYYPNIEIIKRLCEEDWHRIGLAKPILLRTWEIFMQTRASRFKDLEEGRKEGFRETTLKTSLNQALKEVESKLLPEKKEEVIRNLYSLYTADSRTYDGVEELLQQLKNLGLKLGIVSNTVFPASYMEEDLERFGILRFFDVAFFSSRLGIRKPAPRIFEEALSALEVSAAEAVFVGDMFDRDIVGARNAGMRTIWVVREEKWNIHPRQVKGTSVILPLIEKMLKSP